MYHSATRSVFSGFSVGFCVNEENVICYQLELENNLPTFQLNAPVVKSLGQTRWFKLVYKWFTTGYHTPLYQGGATNAQHSCVNSLIV